MAASVRYTKETRMALSQALLNDMSRDWWAVLLRGIVGVAFGVLAFAWPGTTLLALIFLWGVYAIADGAFALYLTISAAQGHRRWWPYLLEGVVGILAGAVAFAWPGITAVALVFLIAAWAVVTGVFEIIAAIDLRRQIRHEWLLALSGALSIFFGVLVVLQPDAGALAIVWLLGAYTFLFGFALITLAFRMRDHEKVLHPDSQSELVDVDSRKVA
jgi:uncharacterized membrane protein HdeD (DUF308 family)